MPTHTTLRTEKPPVHASRSPHPQTPLVNVDMISWSPELLIKALGRHFAMETGPSRFPYQMKNDPLESTRVWIDELKFRREESDKLVAELLGLGVSVGLPPITTPDLCNARAVKSAVHKFWFQNNFLAVCRNDERDFRTACRVEGHRRPCGVMLDARVLREDYANGVYVRPAELKPDDAVRRWVIQFPVSPRYVSNYAREWVLYRSEVERLERQFADPRPCKFPATLEEYLRGKDLTYMGAALAVMELMVELNTQYLRRARHGLYSAYLDYALDIDVELTEVEDKNLDHYHLYMHWEDSRCPGVLFENAEQITDAPVVPRKLATRGKRVVADRGGASPGAFTSKRLQ